MSGRQALSHIHPAVWLRYLLSLSLSLCDVEQILTERGITIAHESIRRWVLRFGTDLARKLRCRRPLPGDTWHGAGYSRPGVKEREGGVGPR